MPTDSRKECERESVVQHEIRGHDLREGVMDMTGKQNQGRSDDTLQKHRLATMLAIPTAPTLVAEPTLRWGDGCGVCESQ